MLRIHFIQHWFNLADLSCEKALYDSASLRRFVGIDLGREPAPDATTMLKFRRLLNDRKLGEALFAKVGQELQSRGFKVNTGTIVDATIIGAPGSTKNADKARDPEMHQTRKGIQWASPSSPDTFNDMMCSGERYDEDEKELHGRIQT